MPDFGKVIGRFLVPVVDGVDPDQTPDLKPLSGKITFTLNASRVIDATASPVPVAMGTLPIQAILDSDGYVSTPSLDGSVQYQGIWLVATDDPDLNPTNMVYKVDYSLALGTIPVKLPSHNLSVPAGSTIDLVLALPAENSVPVGEAAALSLLQLALTDQADMIHGITGLRAIAKLPYADYQALPLEQRMDPTILYITNP